MIDQNDIQKIKEAVEEFLDKMTITSYAVIATLGQDKAKTKRTSEDVLNFSVLTAEPQEKEESENNDTVNVDITLGDPQILIGERGQTLFEAQKLLKTVLSKKLKKYFYLNLDINDYKRKKIDYLRSIAKTLADDVAITKHEKVLIPMSAFERRVIHTELSQRPDIATESQGQGEDRCVVIKPR